MVKCPKCLAETWHIYRNGRDYFAAPPATLSPVGYFRDWLSICVGCQTIVKPSDSPGSFEKAGWLYSWLMHRSLARSRSKNVKWKPPKVVDADDE